jgi:hypothetical protein
MNNIFLIILQTALFLVSINASANTIKNLYLLAWLIFENPKLCLCIGKTTWKIYVDDVKRLIKLAIIFPVDFYFKNATNFEIQQWALKLEINSDVVNEGFITLNHAY